MKRCWPLILTKKGEVVFDDVRGIGEGDRHWSEGVATMPMVALGSDQQRLLFWGDKGLSSGFDGSTRRLV